MLDVKEGDYLAQSQGMLSPPLKLRVVHVHARYVETEGAKKWDRETGRHWGGKSGERVEPWQPKHDLAVERHAAGNLARKIEKRLRDLPGTFTTQGLADLRAAAKAIGMEE